ncbi:MurR/RpiR family transcriptional regulator [Bacillus swezeyi]|uniref:RpiR family transcriptional regulator n=1 Tax=Bacillus swezeyi TaxID=1925020 RepID=A0A1R1RQ03_9BACI|nr:MurR/RpiR family transcriptional regulator [Bacillus swezeyi]MEC1262723.1 MurR/RpiR family transcriptional regulator [Bacillus swezeyi]MED2928566.1 MurR/RpiR family transcriptional regulator [Bacillus swezeyi]MED2945192.1 MurR/RpiR family transcriptional regulator [Bacillus swezeyi]MED2962895.1 MurR/RpiR family transcriptional regulator [Bacillus swezeyi]MED2975787.1 MurR/RpiR family transcriptional regulator [Bacillus swezeyi]
MQLEELMNKHYKKLNENDFHILKYILNHQDTCYKLGINELAKKCNVSRTSILRLSQKLDFSGYSEFRVFLKWEAEKQEEEREDCRSFESLMRDMESSIKYLKNTDMRNICKLIDEADRIFVYGSGTAQTSCALELQRMFISQHRYLTVIRDQIEFELMLPDLSTDDLIIIISLSGETPSLIPQAQTLSARGIPFISLTNLKNNLLAQLTPYNLYATSQAVTVYPKTELIAFAPFFLVGEALFRSYVDYAEEKKIQ